MNGAETGSVIELLRENKRLAAELATEKEFRALERQVLVENATRLAQLEEALLSLLPGLEIDLRYADADDDTDAMRSRIKTVRDCFPAKANNGDQAGSNPAPVLTEQGDAAGSGTGVLTVPHRSSLESPLGDYYRVKMAAGDDGCAHCGAGKQWAIV